MTDIVGGWLLRVTVLVVLVALVTVEAVTLLVTGVTATDRAREVALAAAAAYRDGTEGDATAAAQAAARELEVELVDLEVGAEEVRATVALVADTLLLDGIDAADDLRRRTGSSAVSTL